MKLLGAFSGSLVVVAFVLTIVEICRRYREERFVQRQLREMAEDYARWLAQRERELAPRFQREL